VRSGWQGVEREDARSESEIMCQACLSEFDDDARGLGHCRDRRLGERLLTARNIPSATEPADLESAGRS
jgi:hypothetical protein